MFLNDMRLLCTLYFHILGIRISIGGEKEITVSQVLGGCL